jgi:PPM family protein phosphatase
MFWRKKNNKKEEIQDAYPAPAESPIPLRAVIKTDLGNVRTNNEDAASFFRYADQKIAQEKGCLLIVADGMGGHLAGEVASNMAVDIISEEYFKQQEGGVEQMLSRAFSFANKRIFEMASGDSKYRGMGTTCTALVVLGSAIYFSQVGDSRAYMYKNKSIMRLTEDHTYVNELVKNGDITEAEAATHPQRNVLTNAMGTKPTLRIDTGRCEWQLEPNDRLLICSDGLYDYFTDIELGGMISYGNLQEVADRLIDQAKKRGGKDNITVALAEIAGSSDESNLKLTRDVELPADI